MVPLGLWVAIIGYAVLYSGVIKLGGGQCSLSQAFRGQCVPAKSSSSNSSSTTPGPLPSQPVATSPGGSGDFQP